MIKRVALFRYQGKSVYNHSGMSPANNPGRSLIDGLPPEIAKRINPDWQTNEADYWTKRDSLLAQYSNKWIGFADGIVIASGTSPVEVFHTAQASGKHPFVTCVGHENEPNRMRRASFPYDSIRPTGCEVIESLA